MGDSNDAWETLLSAHGTALVLFARQWASSHADAEDAVQEGFVRCWRGRDRARDLVAYLYTCVRTAALDRCRMDARRKRHEKKIAQAQPAEALFGSDLAQDEQRRAAEEALAELPAEQREVLVMKLWGDLTFVQIGAAVGIPPNTAASRYRYALEALRIRLARVNHERA